MEGSKTPVRKIFGDSPMVKVLDVLIENPSIDYSKRELAEAAGISPTTLYRLWDTLEENGIIEKTRKIGNATLYRTNTESKYVRELVRFERRVLEDEAASSDSHTV